MRWSRPLTGLRALAAFAVLLFHASYIHFVGGGSGGPAVLRLGWVGVDLFFVLSGFLLGRIYLERLGQGTPGAVLGYYRDRLVRIVPAYYVSILVALVMGGQIAFLWQHADSLGLHLLYLHNLIPEHANDITPIYWTLAVEAHFYLLLPLLLPVARTRAWPLMAAALVALSLAFRWALFTPAHLYYAIATLPAFAAHFALGITAARIHGPSPALRRAAGALSAAILLAVLAWLHSFGSYTQAWLDQAANTFARPLLALAFAALLVAVRDEAGALNRVLSTRWLHTWGERSYSLYLTHVPVLLLLARVPHLERVPFWLFVALSLPACLAFAALFHRLVEGPLLRLRAWMRERADQPAP